MDKKKVRMDSYYLTQPVTMNTLNRKLGSVLSKIEYLHHAIDHRANLIWQAAEPYSDDMEVPWHWRQAFETSARLALEIRKLLDVGSFEPEERDDSIS